MKMIKQEWKNLFKNKILLISVIAITFIPIIYTSIFDKSLWSPFKNTQSLPIAVVNEDVPVKLMGQEIDVGSQIIEHLRNNKKIKWEFVNKKQAEIGLKNTKYYSIINIPPNFSKSAVSIIHNNPTKMEISYTTNDSYNYIAGEITEVAAVELKDQIQAEIIKSYVQAIDKLTKKIYPSLEFATHGSEKISLGLEQLSSGLGRYTNGVFEASEGSNKLTNGLDILQSRVPTLSKGVSDLYSGSKKLSSALTNVNEKINTLQPRIKIVVSGISELHKGTEEISNTLEKFEKSMDHKTKEMLTEQILAAQEIIGQLSTNTEKLKKISVTSYEIQKEADNISKETSLISNNFLAENTELNNKITQTIMENKELSQDSKVEIITKLINYTNSNASKIQSIVTDQLTGIQDKLNNFSNLCKIFSQQSSEISQITETMSQNTRDISNSIHNLRSGINTIMEATGNIPSSQNIKGLITSLDTINNQLSLATLDIPKAINGVSEITNGSKKITTGLWNLDSRIPILSDGIIKLDSGSNQLTTGLNTLNSKSEQINSGIRKLKKGSDELSNGLITGLKKSKTFKITEKKINQFYNPVGLIHQNDSPVENYGEGLAPYIMSLALYVGCMLFNFIYPIRKIAIKNQGSNSWWLSKVSLGFIISSIMAIIQVTVMSLLNLPIHSKILLYFTALITSWCYMSIVMFLAMTFDNPGRFAAMILLVLQLGGAGGTFPIQLQGKFFQIIHPYLPMSYSLYAFRNAISKGIPLHLVLKSYIIMIGITILLILLLKYSMRILKKRYLFNVSTLNNNQELCLIETNTAKDIHKQIEFNKSHRKDRK